MPHVFLCTYLFSLPKTRIVYIFFIHLKHCLPKVSLAYSKNFFTLKYFEPNFFILKHNFDPQLHTPGAQWRPKITSPQEAQKIVLINMFSLRKKSFAYKIPNNFNQQQTFYPKLLKPNLFCLKFHLDP